MDFHNCELGVYGCEASRDHAAEGFAVSVEAALPRGVSEALADPIVQALMAADRVDPKNVEALVRCMAARLARGKATAQRHSA
jgi:hypothetical protein